MVMPLVDEDRPKCRVCHASLAGIGELRRHMEAEHGVPPPRGGRGPAPGDVTAF